MKQKFSEEIEEDFNFYNKNLIEEDLENDEINGGEEGFMLGYLG